MSSKLRVFAAIVVAFLAGCSLAGSSLVGCCSAGPSAPSTGSAADPVIVERPLACVAFCERLVACHLELGTRPPESDRDCGTACAPEGVYGRLMPETWACTEHTECTDVWSCAAGDMAGMLIGSLGAAAPATGLPENWPSDFPSVPGGSPIASPPMGPVHVAILAYADRAPTEIGTAYRSALTSAGWTIPDAESAREADADRFVAVRESHSVSVSVYREGAQTYVQTMELNALFGM